MPNTGPKKKESDAKRYQKNKEEKEYSKVKEQVTHILQEVDATGDRYKSEALSQAQLTALYESFVFGHAILGAEVSFEEWLELRDRARKDLFWLGSVLKWHWHEHVHRATCDFFVQKNFDGVYHDGYTIEQVHRAIGRQSKIHHRLLLDPRHHYKTTIDSVDALQWLLNAPDIRIFILTAEEENASEFLTQIKGYMHQPKGHPLTDFQLMYPEYVLRGVQGTSEKDLISPARRLNQRDPSVWADSIMSTLSSQHCDVMKADDVISNRNSDTEDARKKLKKKFDQAFHLLAPHGFLDILGTRYSSDDWYASRLAALEEAEKIGIPDSLRVQVRSGWIVRDGMTEAGVPWSALPLKDLKFEMIDLLFPELKPTPQETFNYFMIEVLQNEQDFRCQILNEPAHDADAPYVNPFTGQLLTASVANAFNLPPSDAGYKYIWWDTALTGGKQSDYCAGVCAQIWERPDHKWELFIWEVMIDKMTTFDLARNMVAFAKRMDPLKTQFETSATMEATKELQSALNTQKMLQGYFGPIEATMADSQKNAKPVRIKGLEVLFRLGLIRFAPGPWIDLVFKQFLDWTGFAKNKGRKDDAPDAIAMLAKRMPYIGVTPNPEGEIIQARLEKEQEQAARRRIQQIAFGNSTAGPTLLNPTPPVDESGNDNPIYRQLNRLKRQ